MVEKVHPLLTTVDQAADPIDTVDISDIEFSPNENALDASFKQGAMKEPDRVAAIIRTARQLNQPPEVVDKNFEVAKKAAERPSTEYFADIIKTNPRVAKFLSDPAAMAVAKDDIPNLINFSDTVKESVRSLNPMNFPGAHPEDYKKMSSDIVAGWQSGRLNVRQAQIGWQRLLETIQTGEWSQFGETELRDIEQEQTTQPQPPKGFAPFYFAGQQLPNFALMAERGALRAGQTAIIGAGGAAALSLLTGPGAPAVGTVTVPAAFFSGLGLGGRIGVAESAAILEGGLAFDEFSKLRDANGRQVSPREAASMALGVGIVNAGLEYASAAALLRTIPGGEKILGMIGKKSIFKNLTPGIAIREAGKRYLESIGTEIATEIAQETTVVEGGNLLKQLSGEPFAPTPPGEQLSRILSVAGPTAQATALLGIPGSTIHVMTDVQAMNRANKAAEVYTKLQDQASKLREREPVMHEQHVADVVKGTPVETIYVDARAAQKYFQSQNIPIEQVADELGVKPEDMASAIERGGDVEVSYARYNSKLGNTEHYAALTGDVKFDPNERTINQAAAKASETSALLVEQAQNVADNDPTVAQGMDFIYNDIKKKMQLSGAYKEDKQGEALMDANARVFAAAIVNMPDRMGRDPKEYYQSMLPVEVQGAQSVPEGGLLQRFYRGGPEGSAPGMTARDVLDYEQNDLGNKDVTTTLSPDELDDIPAANLRWVTEKPKENIRVIAKNNEGGFLVLDTSPQTFFQSPTVEDVVVKAQESAALQRRAKIQSAQVSWESRPGRLTGILPESNDAPFSQQLELHRAITAALRGPEGDNGLATIMGLPIIQEFEGPGVYQGEVSPGSQTEILAKSKSRRKLDEKTRAGLSAYASIMGAILKQEAMAWHRPFYVTDAKQANGIELVTGTPFVAEQARALYNALRPQVSELGLSMDSVGIIPSADGVRVIAFDKVDTLKFHKAVQNAFELSQGDIQAKGYLFATDGDYISNDWKESPNGESYLSRAVDAGFKEAVAYATSVLAPKIRSVHEAFAAKYGWSNPYGRLGVGPDIAKAYDQARLAELNHVQTSSPQFKKWFGDSVITTDGKPGGPPMVVYHGTTANFDTFELPKNEIGIHAGTAVQANDRVAYMTFLRGEIAPGANVKPVYMKITNPLELRDLGTWDKNRMQIALRDLARRELTDDTDLANELSAIDELKNIRDVRNYLIDKGYDGIKYINQFESGRVEVDFDKFKDNPVAASNIEIPPEQQEYSYIAFSPGQIKSAIGNEGTFDPRKHSILLQGNPDEPRGFIEFSDKKTIIGLLKADASTFMHETAHFWLNNFAAHVDSGRATEKQLADWNVLRDWLKIKEGETKLSTDQQEKFARGFEAYLREGVAPSEGLRLAFRRFARWLAKLYRDIRQLNVELTNDVRGVFDRMLATEDEIAFARRASGLDLIPNLEGIDPTVVAKLNDLREEAHQEAIDTLLKKQMKELTPNRREEYNRALEQAQKAAREEVSKEPIYVAAEAIKRSSLKIKDPNALAVAFIDGKLSEQDDISFRMMAEMNGFKSGQEFAKKLMESPGFEQEVNRRVEYAMQDKADLRNTDKIKEEAMKTLATEKQTELLAYERAMFLALVDQAQSNAREIRTRRADARIEADAAKAKAHEIISKTPVEKAGRFMPFFTAERNAATEAYIAAKAGNWGKAADAKQRQMLNHALATEAYRARQAIQNWGDYLHAVQLKDKALFKREEHFNQVAALMARFGIERKDYDPTLRTETLPQWVQRMTDENAAVNVAAWIQDESITMPWREMSVDQMHDLVDTLKNIQHVANAEKNFYRVMAGATIENTILDLNAEAAKWNKPNAPEQIERRNGWIEKIKKAWRGYDAQLVTAETVALKMGGWRDDSLWYRTLIHSANEAGNAESELMRPFAQRYKEILDKHYTQKEREVMVDDGEKIFIPEWNQSVRRISLIVMALNTGTESNRARLFESRVVGIDPAIAWGENEVMGVLQKYLTANDWRFTQDVWDMINSLWPQMAEMHKEVTGFTPEKIEAKSFRVNTPLGQMVEMAGGYFPLKADPRGNLMASIREQLDQPLYTEQNPAFVASTKTGHLKERVQNAKYPVALEISTIQRHIQDAVHDIAWRPTIIDLRRLVNNQAFRQTVIQYGSVEEYQMLRDWVGSAATGDTAQQQVLSYWDKTMRFLKNNFTGAVIVLNPKIVFQNVSNIALYAGAVKGFGWRDVISGMMRYGLTYNLGVLTKAEYAKEMRKFVFDKSSFMLDKDASPDYSLNDTADAMFGKNHAVKNFFKGAMSSFDEITSLPIWRTAYDKAIAEQRTEKEAIEYADNVIERSIGTSRKYKTAAIFRSGETAKSFSTLYGFMSAQYNRWKKERGLLAQDPVKNGPQFLGYVFTHFVIFASLSNIMSGNLPDPDDEEKTKRWLKSVALYPFQMLPVVGQMASVVADNALHLNSFGYRPLPQVAVPEKIILGISKAISAAQGEAEPKDAAEAISHALTFLTGTPDQAVNWFWNAFDIATEGMEPQPGDLLRRRPRSER